MGRRRKLLKNETIYVENMSRFVSGQGLTEFEKKEIETLFEEEGGVVAACNRYMERTIKCIKKQNMSMDGFTVEHAMRWKKLFDNDKLSLKLRTELAHLMYSGDERNRYLS